MSLQLTAVSAALSIAALSCHPKGDMEQQCHDAVEHWRTVSTMPMREGDV